MGNSRDKKEPQKGNQILIEFMTAKQKLKKDHILSKKLLEQEQNALDLDVEIIDDLKTYYKVDFSKLIQTKEDQVPYDNLQDQILDSSKESSYDLTAVRDYFTTHVKTYQLFFNNQEVSYKGQEYNFTENQSQILNIEIIYKEKHWAEQLYCKIKALGQKIKRNAGFLSKLVKISGPALVAFKTYSPFILPALATFHKSGLQLSSVSQFSGPIMKLLPKINSLGGWTMILSLYFGRNWVYSISKVGLLVLFPFLSPLLCIL